MTDVKSKIAKATLAVFSSILFSCAANAEEAGTGWQFSVMPYIWLPSFNADLKYGPPPDNGSSANVNGDEDDFLSMLEGAFMISGEARKGPWFVFSDYLYLHLGNIDSKIKSVDFNPGGGPINVGTSQIGGHVETSLKGSIWTLAGGYALVDNASTRVDLLAGFRYLDLNFSSSWDLNADVTLLNSTQTFAHSGDTDKSDSITTFIVGTKGQYKLGQSAWFIPYYADLGGDSSTFTWQLATGVGYHLSWGDVRLDYRHLAYKQDDNKLVQNVELSGFALGANVQF